VAEDDEVWVAEDDRVWVMTTSMGLHAPRWSDDVSLKMDLHSRHTQTGA
jgi:hypothetical protein